MQRRSPSKFTASATTRSFRRVSLAIPVTKFPPRACACEDCVTRRVGLDCLPFSFHPVAASRRLAAHPNGERNGPAHRKRPSLSNSWRRTGQFVVSHCCADRRYHSEARIPIPHVSSGLPCGRPSAISSALYLHTAARRVAIEPAGERGDGGRYRAFVVERPIHAEAQFHIAVSPCSCDGEIFP